jgi:hypothetical protein
VSRSTIEQVTPSCLLGLLMSKLLLTVKTATLPVTVVSTDQGDLACVWLPEPFLPWV